MESSHTLFSCRRSFCGVTVKSCLDSCAITSWRENDTLVSCRKCDQARRVKIIRICMGIPITNTQKDIYMQKFSIKKPYFIVLVTSLSVRLFP